MVWEIGEQCGRCVQVVKECMNSVRVCTGYKEITKIESQKGRYKLI